MTGKRVLYLLPALVFAVIVGYFVWGLDPARDPSRVPSALIDKPVPQFELAPLDGIGRPGLASAQLQGQVSLVNFFASWCLPCRAEHPLLMRLAGRDGVRLAGINYKDEAADAVRWLEDLGNPYDMIGVDGGRTAIDWGVSGVPETFVIDRAGRIRYQHIGPIHPQQLEQIILPLLEELAR
jgi:cytochrome c biogenesis protein CcmG/thiol:disulfide interchange protein DsbE